MASWHDSCDLFIYFLSFLIQKLQKKSYVVCCSGQQIKYYRPFVSFDSFDQSQFALLCRSLLTLYKLFIQFWFSFHFNLTMWSFQTTQTFVREALTFTTFSFSFTTIPPPQYRRWHTNLTFSKYSKWHCYSTRCRESTK